MLNEENKRNRDHVAINHLNKQECCGQKSFITSMITMSVNQACTFKRLYECILLTFLPLTPLFYIQ